ncbi:hypothetical protein DFH28DRAFT_995593 [Melampsora americana]|nr:hypothetical protein DFH28DRAFT_995593 [Melampsora americana]
MRSAIWRCILVTCLARLVSKISLVQNCFLINLNFELNCVFMLKGQVLHLIYIQLKEKTKRMGGEGLIPQWLPVCRKVFISYSLAFCSPLSYTTSLTDLFGVLTWPGLNFLWIFVEELDESQLDQMG